MDGIANSQAARDKAFLMHPMTNLKKHLDIGPTIVTEGNGIYVKDDAGREYIEGMAGLWCTSLGYGEERLIQAAVKQMRTLPYVQQFRHMSHGPGIDLGEKLVGMAPEGITKAFFVNSGSEANDTIVKFVRFYHNAIGKPLKKKIIARDKGYHGTTLVAASLSGLPHMHAAFDLPIADVKHTNCPHYYRYGQEGESEEDFATRMADNLEKLILDEGPETVAAFFAEPVMGAGGVITPPKTYFAKVQAVLKKYDILFVADEVICGFGRTGKMFGSDTYDLKPDFMTVAKALSSAYLPIAGVLMREEVFQVIAEHSGELGILGHGYTYSGHPVASAVALETLKIYEEIDIVAKVKNTSETFLREIHGFFDHPLVGETRGVGLVGAIELVVDKDKKTPLDPKGPMPDFLYERIMASGLITRPIGNSIAFCPPLIITPNQVEEMFSRFRSALDQMLDHMTREGMLKAA
jgi:4-aminobutyrate--pyruvate transaminase